MVWVWRIRMERAPEGKQVRTAPWGDSGTETSARRPRAELPLRLQGLQRASPHPARAHALGALGGGEDHTIRQRRGSLSKRLFLGHQKLKGKETAHQLRRRQEELPAPASRGRRSGRLRRPAGAFHSPA